MKAEDGPILSRWPANAPAYQALIARFVAELPANTAEGRRAVYARARKALIEHLKVWEPPLVKSDIERALHALERAVGNVEAEQAQRYRRPQDASGAVPPREDCSSSGIGPSPSREAADHDSSG